jgi:hypothetical protein
MTTSTTVTSQREALLSAFESVRSTTVALCEPLEPEDMVVQTMPDASPTKWHLAHATWFFETLILARHQPRYSLFDDRYHDLFNSYYQSLGDPYPRAQRGLLSRPTVDEVRAYRRHVDAAMVDLLQTGSDELIEEVAPLLTVGVHHEQQHQELLLMDVKHVLARNPLHPTYLQQPAQAATPFTPIEWIPFTGGKVRVGSVVGFHERNIGLEPLSASATDWTTPRSRSSQP